jgi:hypothetical protein
MPTQTPPLAQDPRPSGAYRAGSPGKGWLLPDGRLERWAVGPRGGPHHLTRFDALKLPEQWLPAGTRDPAAWQPTEGCALAFNITPEGMLVAHDWSAGLDPTSITAVCAAAVLAYAREHYTINGDQSQAIGEDPYDARQARLTSEHYQRGLTAARTDGRLRRRHCQGVFYELPAQERIELIERLQLGRRWQRRDRDGKLSPSAATEVHRTRLQRLSDNGSSRSFEVPVPGNPQPALRVHLQWIPAGERLRLQVTYGPAGSQTSAAPTTQVPSDAPERERAALLAEMQRFVVAQHRHGETLPAIAAALALVEVSWLRDGAPQHTQQRPPAKQSRG